MQVPDLLFVRVDTTMPTVDSEKLVALITSKTEVIIPVLIFKKGTVY